jgi:N-acetylmuramoyl-L-alanine amidase
MKTIILDPGHGMSNRKAGIYDPGAVSHGIDEADIVMRWVNELREILLLQGHKVIRTRVDDTDPAPISERAKIAAKYKGDIMLSFHCNAANGKANGTETFYRGLTNKPLAEKINTAVVESLGTKNRGAKNESQSQHSRLAIMSFQPCFLLEIGFIDHAFDLAKMLDYTLRKIACEKIADIIA